MTAREEAAYDAHLEVRKEAARDVVQAAEQYGLIISGEEMDGPSTLSPAFTLAVDGVIDAISAAKLANPKAPWTAVEARLARTFDAYIAADIDALSRAHRLAMRTPHRFERRVGGERCRLCLAKLGSGQHVSEVA
jgi:hypothetical protein